MKPPSKTIIAIVAITILESIALLKGVNGALLSICIAAIAGLGGYEIGSKRKSE